MLIYINNEDQRTNELCIEFRKHNYKVSDDYDNKKDYTVYYLGIRGDGCHDLIFNENSHVYTLAYSEQIAIQCNYCKAKYFVLYDDKELVKQNAILTTEGLISTIIQENSIAVKDAAILVMGYGICGKDISYRLNALESNVTVSNRLGKYESEVRNKGLDYCSSEKLNLEKFDFIINTVASNVFSKELLKTMNKECKFYDIASNPYGVHENDRFNQYKILPGLPSKYAYKSAAKLLFKAIEKKEREYV